MKRNLLLFLLFFGIWVLWSGHFEPLLLGFGVFSCAVVMFLSLRAGLLDDEGAPLHITWQVLRYIPWLAWQIVLSNIDVARAIVRGRKAINPQWLVTRAGQHSDVGFVIYANSITLTPGTVTVDLQEHGLLLHALTDAAAEGIRSGDMDRRVCAIEAPV